MRSSLGFQSLPTPFSFFFFYQHYWKKRGLNHFSVWWFSVRENVTLFISWYLVNNWQNILFWYFLNYLKKKMIIWETNNKSIHNHKMHWHINASSFKRKLYYGFYSSYGWIRWIGRELQTSNNNYGQGQLISDSKVSNS